MIERLLGRITVRRVATAFAIALGVSLIWYQAPRVAFDGRSPFATPLSRALLLAALLLILVLYRGLRALKSRVGRLRLVVEKPARDSEEGVVAPAASTKADAPFKQGIEAVLRAIRRDKGRGLWGRGSPYSLPWYVVCGTPQSATGTWLRQSGLKFWEDAALARDWADAPCRWWFAQEAVLLEATGELELATAAGEGDTRWRELLAAVRRARRRLPVNGVVIALGAHDVLAGGERAHRRLAEAIRARIEAMHSAYRIHFPVYFVVTGCEMLEGYQAFFDELPAQQQDQVWGVTFAGIEPGTVEASLGTLESQFAELVRRLLARLRARRPRRAVAEQEAAVCAFPFQFEVLTKPLMRLVRDAFGASPYTAPAMLRGVYFCGAGAPSAIAPFNASALAAAVREAQTPGKARGEVPHRDATGLFATRLLREIVFKEAPLAGAALRTSRRRRFFTRVAVVAALCVAVGAATLLTVSYLRNRASVQALEAAGAELSALAARGVVLDEPRTMLPLLAAARALPEGEAQRAAAVPVWARLGLYQERRLASAAQNQYRGVLRQTLLRYVVARMGAALDAPSLADDARYRLLQCYLMLADKQHYRADVVLQWVKEDAERTTLSTAERAALFEHSQVLFDPAAFRADARLDAALIARTRLALTALSPAMRIYRALDAQLRTALPGSLSVAQMGGVDAALVLRRKSGRLLGDGAARIFTREGYRLYQTLRDRAIDAAGQDAWAIGPEGIRTDDGSTRAALAAGIDSLYFADYVGAWDSLLADVQFVPLSSAPDEPAMAGLLAQPGSAWRLFLQAAANETSLGAAADPVAAPGTPAGTTTREAPMGIVSSAGRRVRAWFGRGSGGASEAGAGPANDQGNEATLTPVDVRFDALHRLVRAGPDGRSQLDDVQQTMAGVAAHLRAVASARERGLPAPPADALGALTQTASLQPSPLAEMLASLYKEAGVVTATGEKGRLTALWRADVAPMCEKALGARYPIDPSSNVDATLDDFARVLGPGGLIDTFFANNIRAYVDMSVEPWAWRREGESLRISRATLQQFEWAAAIRDAFFGPSSKAVSVRFALEPLEMDAAITRATVDLGGQTLSYEHGPRRAVQFAWPPEGDARAARIDFAPAGVDGRTSIGSDGPWAWFRLIDRSERVSRGPDRFDLTFDLGGRALRLRLDAASVVNPFALPALRRFKCLTTL